MNWFVWSFSHLFLTLLLYQFHISNHPNLTFRRYFLLLFPVVGLAFPFIQWTSIVPAAVFSDVVIETRQVFTKSISGTNFWHRDEFMVNMYQLGFSFMLIRFCIQQVSTLILIHRLPVLERKQGITIRVSERNYPTFSFWNQICLHPDDIQKHEIRLHEEAHVRKVHSVDRLFFDILTIFFWFNPFVYVLARKSAYVQELLADQAVLAQKIEPQRYASLILASATGFPLHIPVHNFSKKEGITERIATILHPNPKLNKHTMKFTSLLTICVLAVSVWITACTEQSLHLTENPDVQPAFGVTTQTNLGQFLGKTLVYPESARKDGAEGRVIVEFVITEQGKLQQAQVLKSSGRTDLDSEALRAVSEMTDWKPAQKEGKPVSVKYALPITFKL